MLRLVSVKDDPSPSGARHLDILRRIAKGHVACIGSNHIVPVLQELDDVEHGLTIVVQPKMYDLDGIPSWYTAQEAADFVEQILEVSLASHLCFYQSFTLCAYRRRAWSSAIGISSHIS